MWFTDLDHVFIYSSSNIDSSFNFPIKKREHWGGICLWLNSHPTTVDYMQTQLQKWSHQSSWKEPYRWCKARLQSFKLFHTQVFLQLLFAHGRSCHTLAICCCLCRCHKHKIDVEDNESISHAKTHCKYSSFFSYLRCTLSQKLWEKLHSLPAALPCIRPWHLDTSLPNIQRFTAGLCGVPDTTKKSPRRTKHSCNKCLKNRPTKPTFR